MDMDKHALTNIFWIVYNYQNRNQKVLKFMCSLLVQLIVRETNRNADYFLTSNAIRKSSKYNEWKPTNMQELNK